MTAFKTDHCIFSYLYYMSATLTNLYLNSIPVIFIFSNVKILRQNPSWRMDETYIKIKGRWVYYYRAVDTDNQTIDFYLSEKRDTEAARSFFTKAIGSSGLPDKVNIDKSGANLAGLQAINQGLPEDRRIMVRQIKYLNNLIEQEHRPIKLITRPMLGFKAFISAVATLAGIELQRMLKKGQGILNSDLPAWKQFYALAG
jgi:putative transposase